MCPDTDAIHHERGAINNEVKPKKYKIKWNIAWELLTSELFKWILMQFPHEFFIVNFALAKGTFLSSPGGEVETPKTSQKFIILSTYSVDTKLINKNLHLKREVARGNYL